MTSGFEDDFFHGVEDNPFEDPAITQVTNNASNVSRGLEDYNPFEEGNTASPIRTATISTPAVLQPTQEPPAYKQNAQQTQSVNTSDFQRRQEELDRKAAELERREEELKRQGATQRTNNWPPLPQGFCLQPCFYLDIEVEIKLEFQRIVRHLYYLWILHECMLLANIFGTLCLWIEFGNFKDFCVSILYFLLFSPLSFLCWYRPVYKAFQSDSSIQFMMFFFVFFFQFLVTSFMAIGILGSGTCGIWAAIGCFNGKVGGTIVGIIVLIVALGLAATSGLELLLLAKMMNIYRGTDASFNKARNEFTSGILGNQLVREATTEAAAATIRSQLNQQSNRY